MAVETSTPKRSFDTCKSGRSKATVKAELAQEMAKLMRTLGRRDGRTGESGQAGIADRTRQEISGNRPIRANPSIPIPSARTWTRSRSIMGSMRNSRHSIT